MNWNTETPPELCDGNNRGHVLVLDVFNGMGRLLSVHVDYAKAKGLAWTTCPDFDPFAKPWVQRPFADLEGQQ